MQVVFEKLPSNLAEFKAMEQMDLSKPENTCAMFLCALNLFVKDKSIGVDAINILKGPTPLNAHQISFLSDRLRDKTYLPMIYFEGAVPGNNYTPSVPYTLICHPDPRPQDRSEGYMRLYLKTAGADSPRPVDLRKKDNNWYLWDYPGIAMDVRKPEKDDPWA